MSKTVRLLGAPRQCPLSPPTFQNGGYATNRNAVGEHRKLVAFRPGDELNHAHRERKCADTIGTVLVPWAGHFQC